MLPSRSNSRLQNSNTNLRGRNSKEVKPKNYAAWEGVLSSTSPINNSRSFESFAQNWRSSSRQELHDTSSENDFFDGRQSFPFNRSSVSLNKSFPPGDQSETNITDNQHVPLRSYSKFDERYYEFLSSSRLIYNSPDHKASSELLIEKIKSGGYVDFSDFLPQNILEYTAWDNRHVSHSVDASSTPQITEFAEWIQCMMVYVSVLCEEYPERTADMLGYIANIAMLYQDSDERGAWLRYDVAFRRKASSRRLLTWSKWDKDLWVLATSSEARQNVRCKSCLTSMHDEESCPFSKQAVEFEQLKRSQSHIIERSLD